MLDEADIRPVPAMDNRLLDHLLRRALGDQMSLVEQQDAVGPQGGEVKVMQHHADVQLPAGGEPFEQTQQVLLIVKVQRRGGLIEKQPALRRAVAPDSGPAVPAAARRRRGRDSGDRQGHRSR